jgi:hypothetical protein
MKKIFKSIIGCAAVALMASMMSACSEKIDVQAGVDIVPESGVKTIAMNFEGGVVGFDKTPTKAASANWSDGDKIYIIFYNGTTKVPGEAIYSTAGGWNVSYDGDLAKGTGLKCEVRHFVNATFSSASLVSLNSETEIYETTNGSYEYNGTTLTVQASMTPKTGRIRFSGKSGEKIHLTGISVYTTYSPALNTFSSTKSMITTTVATDGYTPYIYGSLADSNRKLGLIGSDFAFTRTCTDAVLKVGDSGYMAIPSESAHNNWRSGLYVTVGGVEFKMIPVAGHTSGFFLIGETEVTNALYKAVTNSTSVTSNNIARYGVSYDDWETFIAKINYATNLTFDIPTVEQWKYAYSGGLQSQGYTYSGSNHPGDVAWYKANSGGTIHEVKTLAPNELGIYDMSGNIAEFIKDPGSTSYYYGGHYNSPESDLKSTSRTGYISSSSTPAYAGLRVVLICN